MKELSQPLSNQAGAVFQQRVRRELITTRIIPVSFVELKKPGYLPICHLIAIVTASFSLFHPDKRISHLYIIPHFCDFFHPNRNFLRLIPCQLFTSPQFFHPFSRALSMPHTLLYLGMVLRLLFMQVPLVITRRVVTPP